MLDRLTLFFGETNPAEARVYARLEGSTASDGWSLSGRVLGPFCQYAQTLTASVPFALVDSRSDLLAQAVVPDPCFWTPELPFLYRVRVELQRRGETVENCEREFGIRPWGCHGRNFRFDGKSWVLRAVRRERPNSADLPACREHDLSLWTASPSDELCSQASRLGILIVAKLRGSLDDCEDEVVRLSRHAAVGMAVLSTEIAAEDGERLRGSAINLLFGRSVVAPSMQVAIVSASDAAENAEIPHLQLPLVVVSDDPPPSNIAGARAACDRLQRDMAPYGQFAGYVV